MSQQPFAGIVAPELAEATCQRVWPTIGATATGRWVGRWAAVQRGVGDFFTLGKLLAFLAIPLAIAVFLWQLLPGIYHRYVLTNRRIIYRKGYRAVDQRWLDWDEFDEIRVVCLPGQQWLRSGELIFYRSGVEVFRLSGVARPEVLRQACLTVQQAFISIKAASG